MFRQRLNVVVQIRSEWLASCNPCKAHVLTTRMVALMNYLCQVWAWGFVIQFLCLDGARRAVSTACLGDKLVKESELVPVGGSAFVLVLMLEASLTLW